MYVAGNTPTFIHEGGGEGIGSKAGRTLFHCGRLKRMAPYAQLIYLSPRCQVRVSGQDEEVWTCWRKNVTGAAFWNIKHFRHLVFSLCFLSVV